MGYAYDDVYTDDVYTDDVYTDDDDASHGVSFENYVPTTVEPGPWLFHGTIVFVVILCLSVAPLVYYGRKWKKYRKAKKLEQAQRGLAGSPATKLELPYVRKDQEFDKDTSDDDTLGEYVAIEVQMAHKPKKTRKKNIGLLLESKTEVVQQDRFPGIHEKKKSKKSKQGARVYPSKPKPSKLHPKIIGQASITAADTSRTVESYEPASMQPMSSITSRGLRALGIGRRHKTKLPEETDGIMRRSTLEEIQREREDRKISDSYLLKLLDQIVDPYVYDESEARGIEDDNESLLLAKRKFSRGNNASSHLRSGRTRSSTFPAQLAPSEAMPLQSLAPHEIRRKQSFFVGTNQNDEDEDDVPDDAFGMYYERNDEDKPLSAEAEETGDDKSPKAPETSETIRGWATFQTVISNDKEARKIFKIAIPATLGGICDAFLEVLVIAIVARNVGSEAFTAYSLVDLVLGISDSMIEGVDGALSTLTAQAIGAEKNHLAGQYAQLSLTVFTIMSIPAYLFWAVLPGRFPLWLGLGENIAAYTREFMPYGIICHYVSGLCEIFEALMWSADYGKAMTIIDLSFAALLVLILAVVTMTVEKVTLTTIGSVCVIDAFLYVLFVFPFTAYKGWLQPFWRGLVGKLAIMDQLLLKRVLHLAVPLTIGSLLTDGEWEILTFFAAYMGAAEVAAWSIAGAIWELFSDAAAGVSEAAEIRVSYHLGRGNPLMAKISSYKNLLYGGLLSVFVTVIFSCFWRQIMGLFTNDETLLQMLESLVPYMAVANVLMTVGEVAFYVITAQTRPKLCTRIFFICTWLCVIPWSCFLVFHLHYNLEAMVAAVTIAYGAVSVIFIYVVSTSNWAKISKKVVARMAEIEDDDDDDDDESSSSSSSSDEE